MTFPTPFYLSREALRLGSDRQLRRRHADGSLIRLTTGVYIETAHFTALDSTDQYRTRVRAVALRGDPAAQFSHDSAAAEWGLPSIGPWPQVAHQVVSPSAAGISRVGVRRHAIGIDPKAIELNGLVVTSLARTVADMAASTAFVRAVAMADRALRLQPGLDIEAALEERDAARGAARARSVIHHASPRSDSPGESFARVQFLALGYPEPELQVEFFDDQGLAGEADFYFRELDLIIEFDGDVKYGAARQFQRELSLEQILLKEKAREDRLRRQVRSFARINWRLAADRRGLANHLRPHGLVERGRTRSHLREQISDIQGGF